MTINEKIALVKVLYGKNADGNSVADADVAPFLMVAKSIIQNVYDPFGNTETLPRKYDILQCRIANFMMVKQGAEGEIQHTENGVTCIYGKDDIPADMLHEIMPKVGVLGDARLDEE